MKSGFFKIILNSFVILKFGLSFEQIINNVYNGTYVPNTDLCSYETFLNENEAIVSPNGKYQFYLGEDGNAILRNEDKIVWQSNTSNVWFASPPYKIVLSDRAEILIKDAHDYTIWETVKEQDDILDSQYSVVLTDEGSLTIKNKHYCDNQKKCDYIGGTYDSVNDTCTKVKNGHTYNYDLKNYYCSYSRVCYNNKIKDMACCDAEYENKAEGDILELQSKLLKEAYKDDNEIQSKSDNKELLDQYFGFESWFLCTKKDNGEFHQIVEIQHENYDGTDFDERPSEPFVYPSEEEFQNLCYQYERTLYYLDGDCFVSNKDSEFINYCRDVMKGTFVNFDSYYSCYWDEDEYISDQTSGNAYAKEEEEQDDDEEAEEEEDDEYTGKDEYDLWTLSENGELPNIKTYLDAPYYRLFYYCGEKSRRDQNLYYMSSDEIKMSRLHKTEKIINKENSVKFYFNYKDNKLYFEDNTADDTTKNKLEVLFTNVSDAVMNFLEIENNGILKLFDENGKVIFEMGNPSEIGNYRVSIDYIEEDQSYHLVIKNDKRITYSYPELESSTTTTTTTTTTTEVEPTTTSISVQPTPETKIIYTALTYKGKNSVKKNKYLGVSKIGNMKKLKLKQSNSYYTWLLTSTSEPSFMHLSDGKKGDVGTPTEYCLNVSNSKNHFGKHYIDLVECNKAQYKFKFNDNVINIYHAKDNSYYTNAFHKKLCVYFSSNPFVTECKINNMVLPGLIWKSSIVGQYDEIEGPVVPTTATTTTTTTITKTKTKKTKTKKTKTTKVKTTKVKTTKTKTKKTKTTKSKSRKNNH